MKTQTITNALKTANEQNTPETTVQTVIQLANSGANIFSPLKWTPFQEQTLAALFHANALKITNPHDRLKAYRQMIDTFMTQKKEALVCRYPSSTAEVWKFFQNTINNAIKRPHYEHDAVTQATQDNLNAIAGVINAYSKSANKSPQTSDRTRLSIIDANYNLGHLTTAILTPPKAKKIRTRLRGLSALARS